MVLFGGPFFSFVNTDAFFHPSRKVMVMPKKTQTPKKDSSNQATHQIVHWYPKHNSESIFPYVIELRMTHIYLIKWKCIFNCQGKNVSGKSNHCFNWSVQCGQKDKMITWSSINVSFTSETQKVFFDKYYVSFLWLVSCKSSFARFICHQRTSHVKHSLLRHPGRSFQYSSVSISAVVKP